MGNVSKLVGDTALTVFAFAILGITFYGVSAMTPRTNNAIVSQNNTAVLGAKSTNTSSLSFFPQSMASLPYVQKSTFSSNAQFSGSATSVITLTALTTTAYTITPVSIKNTGTELKTVIVTPEYSVEGSYSTISLQYEGHSLIMIDQKGTVTPAEIIIDPNTITPITVTVEPTTTLQVPPTLTLSFTEKP